MAKDPAFLFYPDNFILGTADLSHEEVGQYIRLLGYLHQKGHMSIRKMEKMVGKLSDDLKEKFTKDEEGLFFNERLDVEMQKRAKFVHSV